MELPPISASWHRIENWLHDRERLRELAPPATHQAITQLEHHLGAAVHPDHAQLLLGHNGSGGFALPPHYEILSTDEIVAVWQIKRAVWANEPRPYGPHWVPFASDRAGGVLYLDATRPHQGIQEHDKEGASALSSHVMWASLPSLMHHTADALESGHVLDRYRRSGEDGDLLVWDVVLDTPDA
ncbi:SMI1/KNR4 family protein [Streptomyces sp. NPDC052687]|uniref:SMI1/KNR4 family protein n=1 Tax=Streptomyces sp. NPDC052687 TaxID=3154759 RepID=UPI0034346B9C